MKKKDVAIALVVAVVVVWFLQPPWIANVRSAIQEWREPPRRTPNRYDLRDRERSRADDRARERRSDDNQGPEARPDAAPRPQADPRDFADELRHALERGWQRKGPVDLSSDASALTTLSGKITVNGRPPQEGTITIQSAGETHSVEVALSPDGSYESEGRPAGTCILRLRVTAGDNDWRKHSADVTLQTGRNVFSYDFPAYGSVAGKVTGLRQDESGGVFAIKGEYSLANVSEDDLYDFGDIADAEAHIAKDGTFTIRDLEAGHYTIIAFSGRYVEDRKFFYTFKGVDIASNSQSHVVMSLD